ncbi:Uracil-DNA glycosylase superfamily [Oceanithermus profundus DSM 14977]|uniref:Type-5 uracil-DNA glycosylase n=1 Tax=Oceanithermus profundus (strain DSM 14977 / NBRC 100410 / VKM B-2274 / 506) TaxID=670487 RepID=E4U9L6_OCEP5|nr:Uracil-DNA glycosylase superfamily [Oceanithermus profundus DSM 14977]
MAGVTPERLEDLYRELAACRRCERLVAWREEVGRKKRRAFRAETYWARPVPGFGDPNARLLIFGLAPGAHGSNRTGRMFTGDASGDFLYPALWRAGLASRPRSERPGDGLELRGAYITAAVRCAPPGNKPTRAEFAACSAWTARELALLPELRVYLALGRLAHDALLEHHGLVKARFPFAHGAEHALPDGRVLLDSYHVSRQNTQTGRLTAAMFDEVLARAKALAELA